MAENLIQSLDRVQALVESGQIDDAVALLNSLKHLHPDNLEVWFTLGRAQGMLGHEAEAEYAFSRAVQLRPEMHEAHLNLALSRVYQQKLRDAIGSFVAARRLKPDIPGLDLTLLDLLQSVLQQESGEPANRLQLDALGNAPLVSVVMPTHNRIGLLRDAVDSVTHQTYRNWELIVVNDGGEDISGVINALPESVATKVNALQLRTSAGPGRARNRAIEVAQGDIVAFLDDDDLYLPGHLDALVNGLREHGTGFAYTLSEKVNERVDGTARIELQRNAIFQDYVYSRALLLVRNYIPIDNWGIRRACLEECGLFDTSPACMGMEDWDLLLRISDRSDFHRIAKVTAEVRIRKGISDSVSTQVTSRSTCELLYERYPSRGNEWIDLARKLYLAALFPSLSREP